jgi:hypothetical protein
MSFSPHRHRHPSPSPTPSCPSCHPVLFFPRRQDAQDLQDVLQPPPPPPSIAVSQPILSILPSCPLLPPQTGCTGSTGCPSAHHRHRHPSPSPNPSCPSCHPVLFLPRRQDAQDLQDALQPPPPPPPIAFSHPILSILTSCPLLPRRQDAQDLQDALQPTTATVTHQSLPTHPAPFSLQTDSQSTAGKRLGR